VALTRALRPWKVSLTMPWDGIDASFHHILSLARYADRWRRFGTVRIRKQEDKARCTDSRGYPVETP